MLREMVLMRAKAKQVIVRVLNPTDLLCKSPPLAGEARFRERRLFCGRPCKSSSLAGEVRSALVRVDAKHPCKPPPLAGEVRCREYRLFCGRPCKSPPLAGEARLNRWFRFWELPPPARFLLVLFHQAIVVCVLSPRDMCRIYILDWICCYLDYGYMVYCCVILVKSTSCQTESWPYLARLSWISASVRRIPDPGTN